MVLSKQTRDENASEEHDGMSTRKEAFAHRQASTVHLFELTDIWFSWKYRTLCSFARSGRKATSSDRFNMDVANSV